MTFIIFLVVILFILAISDLIIGVSNDAVNFLNSAIGSKAAPYRVIIITAIVGILLGSFFSSGIMEIARKGIFHPEYFTFDKIMWVFLAVMLTDIILLDIFNSLGLPTSTTVSIVFELLGAAFVVGILFSIEKNDSIADAFQYINFESTISIITGIFLSVFIAFFCGVVFQYLFRQLFTFEYANRLKQFGAIFAGFGITSIVYFLLIKGLKGTTLFNPNSIAWVNDNIILLLVIIFIVIVLICFLLQHYTQVNPLKIVVLAGTFALAMAFAGNDLVNFIGVPITGYLAFQNWVASGIPAGELYQSYLASDDVIVPNYMLLIAGIIMSLTIWFNAKARKVTETEVNLSRQDEGEERFKANAVSRSIVKSSIMLGNLVSVFLPRNTYKNYRLNLEKSKIQKATNVQGEDSAAFDLVRASSNLVIASIIIAWATSMKLPLSTTYVTFMVAMGSSLADRAWGRESAVYRVAGVMSVIGGWFITAVIAFVVAGLFALILYKGEVTGTIILICFTLTYIIFSHIKFTQKEKKAQKLKGKFTVLEASDFDLFERNKRMVNNVLMELSQNYHSTISSLNDNNTSKLKKVNADMDEMVQYGFKIRTKSIKYIKELQTTDKETAEVILYSTDLLQDMIQSAKFLTEESLEYINNLHQAPQKSFIKTIDKLNNKMDAFFKLIIESLSDPESIDYDVVRKNRDELREFINSHLDRQISEIQQRNLSTKQAILQTNIFLQSRDILAVMLRISKMYRRYQK
jgi:phosphate/sulfate permease